MIEVSLDTGEMMEGAILGIERVLAVVRPRQAVHWERNIQGALAEMAAAKAVGVKFLPTINTFHTEADLPWALEVRWAEKRDRSLLVRSNDVLDRRFILVTGRAPTFLVPGWAWGREVVENGSAVNTFDEEKQHVWGLPQEQLRKIETLELA